MNIFLNILLILFAVIILLFLLIFFLVVKVCFDYDTDTGKMNLYLKVIFVKYKIFPADPAKAKRKADKKAKKKDKEKTKKSSSEITSGNYITDEDLKRMEDDAKGASEKVKAKEKVPFSDRINSFTSLVRTLTEKILILSPAVRSSLKLEIKELNIIVASADAANAAIGYGAVCAAIEGLCAVSREVRGFKLADDVFVGVDYCREKFSANMKLVLHIRLAKLIIPALKVLFK